MAAFTLKAMVAMAQGVGIAGPFVAGLRQYPIAGKFVVYKK